MNHDVANPPRDRCLGALETAAWPPDSAPHDPGEALTRAAAAMTEAGCAGAGQQMGERWPIGCVALEITQRCNLDCTLCYLSEHSEAVRDLPMEEILRRIDAISQHYGPGVDVQVTGGDPTLRKREELVAIIERLAARGHRATLMTNGIRASRELLATLAAAGLHDVAFHVDTTQSRKGFTDEVSLNRLRGEYVERARGLGLSVMFNTSVHGGNLPDVPDIVRFLGQHADVVRTASFQLQADTGRGTLRGRPAALDLAAVWSAIESGLGTPLEHEASFAGHPRCSRYGLALLAGEIACDAFDERTFIGALQTATRHLALDRRRPSRTFRAFAAWLALHPRWAGACLTWATRKALRLARPLLAARGRVRTLSFVAHDFMHACALEHERVGACVFKVMSADGPISMCVHNARRDAEILRPVALTTGHFEPLSRPASAMPRQTLPIDPAEHGLKRTKGHTRRRLLSARRTVSVPGP